MDTDALSQRLFQNVTSALEMYAVYLGERLGYYRALADGPMTSAELATATGTAERYTREWLEHHATAGLLEMDEEQRFTLPPSHIPVLADRESVLFDTQHSINLVRVGRRMADLVEAYRTGDAPPPIPWEPEGRAESNRALFLNLLGKKWLPAIPEVHKRLSAGPARVSDIACGLGWSSIAMALAYPELTVDGLDLDEMAISAAQQNAEASGVADRVKFSAMDAADLAGAEKYDLVTIIEALHDMTHPVAALTAARKLLADNGSVLVIDLWTEEELTTPGPVREQQEYGWSLTVCLPGAMGDPTSAETGTVMRPATLRKYALEAGFTNVTIHPIENDKFRFYELT
ncbi:2-polyprenyl-3-methyl-5-hydroxy-6-metoxy-1,4-benzoquinol methylase [Kibdelosporangium banguiense]|uniref:2-polyprenyl-3-methyl-5-hydroxy-6-metoxy-1, 4-benzoquinol methylase n=1 Tax=Kibdelosporangium banguiense TaxID=1365924 RepID=A0ABS4TQR4_9PSEU|nr:class I SAM-dependent methyltransferase [Kibdelosporangium banguiense]MBP2326751.1 2-polyprenyl-3-methyl-5-hydroxy-6-metoxy-1,4-benzoquinol methylase [Kibdelosporangium banguiense]